MPAFAATFDVTAERCRAAALDRDHGTAARTGQRSAVLIALLAGDISKARLLCDSGADPNARGLYGCSPLFYAIQGHHPEVLRWLLKEGSDVYQVDDFGMTALIEAVENDDLECVDILLDAGADVEANATSRADGAGPATYSIWPALGRRHSTIQC